MGQVRVHRTDQFLLPANRHWSRAHPLHCGGPPETQLLGARDTRPRRAGGQATGQRPAKGSGRRSLLSPASCRWPRRSQVAGRGRGGRRPQSNEDAETLSVPGVTGPLGRTPGGNAADNGSEAQNRQPPIEPIRVIRLESGGGSEAWYHAVRRDGLSAMSIEWVVPAGRDRYQFAARSAAMRVIDVWNPMRAAAATGLARN
jgi:hypothetical protein